MHKWKTNRMDETNKIKLTTKQKINFYWWPIFWWSPATIAFIYLVYAFFTSNGRFDIENRAIFAMLVVLLVLYLIGFVGYLMLKAALKFNVIESLYSKEKNFEYSLEAIREIGWKQNNIRKSQLIVSEKGLDIHPGQIITIVPLEDAILFNCIIISNNLFNVRTIAKRNFDIFKNTIIEIGENEK